MTIFGCRKCWNSFRYEMHYNRTGSEAISFSDLLYSSSSTRNINPLTPGTPSSASFCKMYMFYKVESEILISTLFTRILIKFPNSKWIDRSSTWGKISPAPVQCFHVNDADFRMKHTVSLYTLFSRLIFF